jgi:GLPGLI family protein
LNIHLQFRIITFLLLSFFLIGCNGGEEATGPTEGIITYDVSYPKPAADPFDQKMMPSEMTMKFKENKSLTTLLFGMGFVQMAYLSDNEKKTITELNKFMGKKRAFVTDQKNLPNLLKEIPPYTIEYIENQNKIIAGYNCKKALIHVQVDPPYEFSVFYTDEIQIKDPNWCTPFKNIKGVLMEYQIEQYNIIMRFKAKTVELIDQEEGDFKMPADFKLVSQQDMDEIHKMLKEMNE